MAHSTFNGSLESKGEPALTTDESTHSQTGGRLLLSLPFSLPAIPQYELPVRAIMRDPTIDFNAINEESNQSVQSFIGSLNEPETPSLITFPRTDAVALVDRYANLVSDEVEQAEAEASALARLAAEEAVSLLLELSRENLEPYMRAATPIARIIGRLEFSASSSNRFDPHP